MQQELLPLFPLSVVLFPRTRLPLHIFEDRYKEMIGDAIRDETEFGIVLAVDKGLVSSGCTAVVDEITQRYPDGRLDIVTRGVRRFEIESLDTAKEYLRGAVQFFNDDEISAATTDEQQQAVAGFEALRKFINDRDIPEPEWGDPQLSFQLAQAVNDLEFRQQLLLVRSESERIRRLADFLPQHLADQKHISHVRGVAPSNGHGHKLPEI